VSSGGEIKDPNATVVDRAMPLSQEARPTLPDKLDPNDVTTLMAEIRMRPSDRLVVEKTIAQGGMGSIEQATDRALVRRVARKVLHSHLRDGDGLVRMFLREARVNGVLDHPNVVPVYDVGEDDKGQLYFTMKLVEGMALKDLIRALPDGALDMSQLLNMLDVVIKVCDALAFAHSRGVLHCDVKPANVMVGDYGEVYLMDWGISRLVGSSKGTVPPPRPDAPPASASAPSLAADQTNDVVIGTASYMSPEQAQGNRSALDARADVFLVGALIFEIVARKPPYHGGSFQETLNQAVECKPPKLSEVAKNVPPELERIVDRAMHKERAQRYGNLREMKDDLVRFMRGGAEFPKTTFPKGSYIVKEGDKGDAAYIIESGKCDVLKIIDGAVSVMQRIGPGEVFGEMAVLTDSPRTATVLAVEDTTVLVVTRKVFDAELALMKPWMRSVTTMLATRFRDLYASKRVTHMGAPNPVRIAKQLYMHLGAWGTPSADGSVSAKWTTTAQEIETQLGVSIAMGILGVTTRFPMVKVDFATDSIMITNMMELKKALGG
jgi:serine/threonine-protein kinase